MEEYLRDKKIKQVRSMLSLLSITEEQLKEFDALCEDLDLTVKDVTDWENLDEFFNPQEVK